MTDQQRHIDEPIDKRQIDPGKPAGRARSRAIRARMAATGEPFTVAARRHDEQRGAAIPEQAIGRTVYPAGTDTHRRAMIEVRLRWSFAQRVVDARRAADLPAGRAGHLADRFPPSRGEPHTGVGPLYHGADRRDLLALLYAVVGHESPGLVPAPGELAWIAELGEETAVDTACAELDRAARLLLDGDRVGLLARIEAAAAGVRHILDAVLVVGEDGHAPGTRVRISRGPAAGRTGTVVGVAWGPTGPPTGYQVRPDAAKARVPAPTAVPVAVMPDELTVLSAPDPY